MKKYLLAALMSPLISHGQSIGISVYDLISDAPFLTPIFTLYIQASVHQLTSTDKLLSYHQIC